ncbi:imelysin family protein [Tenacibaculum aestuariivivum]|uniref:imelysin family protein n=1 Tax=Tenacibaculum aestuariivivum TaxID=2006131 RepID=UPI003AB5C368
MLHFKNLLILIITILIINTISIFISCNDTGITENEYQIEYYRATQFKNIYENEIIILANKFVSQTTTFKQQINSFKQTPLLENLIATQNSWKSVMNTWKQLELYNLGAIENSFIHFEINRWKTNTNLINSYIEGTDDINEAYINSKGSSAKGLAALEYLLFSSNNTQEVLNTLTNNNIRRLSYLLALADDLENKAIQLEALWINNKNTFITSVENSINGSQNQLTNAMVSLLEEIIIAKLGDPLGEQTNGVSDINLLEAYRSGYSLNIIYKHLIAIEKCYTGNFKENTIQWGYDNYLNLIGKATLNKKIKESFTDCKLKISSIKNPLREELINNKQNVVNLRASFTNLLILIKVDLANAIGSTITISDNDGD